MLLYNGNKVVAKSATNMPNDYLYPVEGVEHSELPPELFVKGTDREHKVSMERVMYTWIANRVIPEMRENIKDILNEMGEPVYTIAAMVEYTEARQAYDDFWVSLR